MNSYIEHYAIKLLNEIGVDRLPINPFDLSDTLGIKVSEIDAGDDFDGMHYFINGIPIINLNKRISNRKRKRFTLAHELGHFSIPEHRKKRFSCPSSFLNPFNVNPKEETEANQFASELLLPTYLFKPLLNTYKPDFESIEELSEDYDTSLTVTAIKFVQNTLDSCALVATSRNTIKWFQKSSSFPFRIEQGTKVSAGTLTASYSLKGISQEPLTQEVHATYWVNGRGIDNSTTLFESCIPMPYYDFVLTMLWFPDPPFEDLDISEDDEEYRYEEDDNFFRWREPDDLDNETPPH